MHLLANSNGHQGGNSQHNSGGSQDVVVKSSSDVKVLSILCAFEKKQNENEFFFVCILIGTHIL